MKRRMFLQLFEDGSGAGSGNQGGNAGSGDGSQGSAGGTGNQGTYSYAQAEEIATARAQRAERAALSSYFQQQGMTEEQARQAIADYKERQKANQPNVDEIQRERDAARKEVEQMKNEKILTAKGVKADDLDYVMFKVAKLVDDKTDFKKAAEKFLKENPRFTGQAYRVSTGVQSTGAEGTEKGNDFINAAIRRAAGRQV